MEEYSFELNPFILTLTALLLLLLSVILLWYYSYSVPAAASKRKLPPSPRKLPIIGNLHQLRSHPHQDLHSMAKKHGPVMLLHFGSSPALIISSADWAREIMKNHDLVFASRPSYKVARKLLYDCRDVLAAPYSEYWRKMKSVMVLQLLNSKKVQSALSIIEEETAILVEKIRESSGAVNLSEMLAQMTSDGIGRSAFGKRYSESDKGKRFLNLLKEFMEILGFLEIGEFIPWLSWISRVNGMDKRIDRVAKEMDQVLESVIEERMQDFKGGENEECFLDIVLQIYHGQYHDLSIDKENIKALILDVFVAGTDTTSISMEWIMSEILRHPTAMEKLQQEVRGLIATQKQQITHYDIEKMHYMKAVIKESFRLHAPVPLLGPRIARQDVQINGYDVSAGTIVMVNAWGIGRDPVSWDEPEKFKPERFLNSSIDLKGLDFELIPFGAGRRGCPGLGYALATIEIVLANLVHKFDWKLANGVEGKDLDMSESSGGTCHRIVPLLVVASTHE